MSPVDEQQLQPPSASPEPEPAAVLAEPNSDSTVVVIVEPEAPQRLSSLSSIPDADKPLPRPNRSPPPAAGPSRISLPPADNVPGPSRRNTGSYDKSPAGSISGPASPQPIPVPFSRPADALLRDRGDRRALSSLGHGAISDDRYQPARAVSYDPRMARHAARRGVQSEVFERAAAGERPRTAPYGTVGEEYVGTNVDWMIPNVPPDARVPPNGNMPMPNASGYASVDVKEVSSSITREKTVSERLQPTLEHANTELAAYTLKGDTHREKPDLTDGALFGFFRRLRAVAGLPRHAVAWGPDGQSSRLTGYSLNACIGLQVLLGAVTTGVAAATTGKSASIGVAVLGGLSTLAASYLARTRGSGEPEASTARCKDLENFIRECEAFTLDKGHVIGTEYDYVIEKFRQRFEEIMGNVSNGPIDGQKEKGNSSV
ncbi:hypothetical protein BKA93DRAFT_830129 [Sparassis latifolia]